MPRMKALLTALPGSLYHHAVICTHHVHSPLDWTLHKHAIVVNVYESSHHTGSG
jgi:hypothetical protein